MKIFLRDLDTELFFRSPDQWVKNHWAATDFMEKDRAETAAKSLAKPNLEIICFDSDGRPAWGLKLDP